MDITTIDNCDNDLANAIIDLLQSDNVAKGHPKNKKELTVAVKENGDLLGGATAYAIWDYVQVDQLFVKAQKKGTGTKIMKCIEEWARALGKKGIYLDTAEWQAAGFYEKLGYHRIGTVPKFSKDQDNYYYLKVF